MIFTRGRAGSSPLTRGTQVVDHLHVAGLRFIPAHAGNTRSRTSRRSGGSVHPRSRGEHLIALNKARQKIGSSPLTRGTRQGQLHLQANQLVHPRSRGEHDVVKCRHAKPGGSSPLTRGTPLRSYRRPPGVRFIPAHAGNTTAVAEARAGSAVHPRSRGEHIPPPCSACQNDGSSPLTRGTHNGSWMESRCERFIPAHAGNTIRRPVRRSRLSVHPRSRGEHKTKSPKRKPWCGSSPLTRGTHVEPVFMRANQRFIPAHAGNTWRWRGRSRAAAVHPRSRGEHNWSWLASSPAPGSSPLTRGTPEGHGQEPDQDRFIPAHAGNTLSVTNCSQRGKSVAKNPPTFPC